MSLNQYHKKRDFSKSPEPKGKLTKKTPRLFVIQKHAASHLHYDFRIELHGVLKSWAIPKGPSLDPQKKRLAIHVEDHPIAYGSFEGIIPKGHYGAGRVMLWDKGSWEPLDKNPYQAYEKGHLRFNLHGEKLNGRWDLIRFKDEKHWFLIKYEDDYATDSDITSALDNIGTQSPFPDFIKPQLATLVNKPPNDEQWLHEIKFDGYRILAFKKGNKVILKSRNNKDWTKDLPAIAQEIQKLPIKNIVLDGEVVMLDQKGKSDFQLLQNSIKNKSSTPLHYYLFDLLYYDHYDLRKLPLLERKTLLKTLIDDKSSMLHYSDHILKEGKEMFERSCQMGLEGIVSKRIDRPYSSNRGKDWLKIKCSKRQEFVIGGYTSPQGDRDYFGSLLLGVFNKAGELEYSGNVGTGFNSASLKEIHQQLLKQKSQKNPFNSKPPGYSKVHWVHPKLVAEVEFSQWTKDKHLRHPSFKGMRMDKKPSEVIHEEEAPLEELKLTNPTKILYPEDKITKEDLLIYYDSISEYILPFISSRPLTLLRCPANYKECFFQRHYNKTTPKTLHSIDAEKYIYLKNKAGLLSLVQMGVLEIHPWGSKITHLEEPDIIIFDLDPAPDMPWSKVVAGAYKIRDYLAEYQLKSFVKTTGGKGLHVVVPIKPEYDWEDVKEFTHTFVRFLEKSEPQEFISNMSKSKRRGKIFVDYLRNQRAATAVSAYSTRARIHAPVSTPLAWEELSNQIEDNTYTVKTLPKRLKKLKKDPWHDFWTIKQSLRLNEL